MHNIVSGNGKHLNAHGTAPKKVSVTGEDECQNDSTGHDQAQAAAIYLEQTKPEVHLFPRRFTMTDKRLTAGLLLHCKQSYTVRAYANFNRFIERYGLRSSLPLC